MSCAVVRLRRPSISEVANTEAFTLDDNLFCPIADGPYAGEDCRDVLEEAIAWWDTQLALIEESIDRDRDTCER